MVKVNCGATLSRRSYTTLGSTSSFAGGRALPIPTFRLPVCGACIMWRTPCCRRARSYHAHEHDDHEVYYIIRATARMQVDDEVRQGVRSGHHLHQ